jgi:hypothetical protein
VNAGHLDVDLSVLARGFHDLFARDEHRAATALGMMTPARRPLRITP